MPFGNSKKLEEAYVVGIKEKSEYKIKDIAKLYFERGIDKVIVMSGKNAYKSTGAWAVVEKALKENRIEYI